MQRDQNDFMFKDGETTPRNQAVVPSDYYGYNLSLGHHQSAMKRPNLDLYQADTLEYSDYVARGIGHYFSNAASNKVVPEPERESFGSNQDRYDPSQCMPHVEKKAY